jgi:tRNA G10  N-methylase Trm11
MLPTSSCIFASDIAQGSIRAVSKNAAIAGIRDSLSIHQKAIANLHNTIRPSSLDAIVTDPPRLSKHVSERQVTKIYLDLFAQAKRLLKPGGKLVIISPHLDWSLRHSAESPKEVKRVTQGQEPRWLLLFERE